MQRFDVPNYGIVWPYFALGRGGSKAVLSEAALLEGIAIL